MKTNSVISKSCLAALTLLLTQNLSYAMPASETENAKPHPLAQSIGEPIDSSASEFELTYSADGKTVVFVSMRPGSIESEGNPYNFDIWMSHNSLTGKPLV